jgi:bifunctional UDP-N-acetylglucosamine pyrophosphorylase/glucosamine-1-phosphate N-acetyltransferase
MAAASVTNVLLLCGGESSRFWPFHVKTLTSFLGTPLLTHHFNQLLSCGVTQVILVTNRQTDEAIRAVSPPNGMNVTYVIQEKDGMAGAVLAARDHCGNDTVILNGSDIYDTQFMTELFAMPNTTSVIGAVVKNDYFPGGYVVSTGDGVIERIVEKPGKGNEPSNVVTIVADRFTDFPAFVECIKKTETQPSTQYEDAMNMYIATGHTCVSVVTGTTWTALKYPWHTLDMMQVFLSSLHDQTIHPSVTIKSNVIIEGPVYIEEGVKIYEGVKIVGPVYIGKGTIIGNNSMVRESMLGDGCVTGFNSDITRSYIGDNCWFHTNYIGDAVLGNNISLGSGAVLANLRLDDGPIISVVKNEKIDTQKNKLGAMIGDNVRIGINVSVMPGVKIGSGSFLSSGLTILGDVPDNSFVRYTKTSYEIVPNTSQASTSREQFKSKI